VGAERHFPDHGPLLAILCALVRCGRFGTLRGGLQLAAQLALAGVSVDAVLRDAERLEGWAG
jgi:hypothetical protein